MRIAYYFDYDQADGHRGLDRPEDVVASVRRWMADDDRGVLWRLGDGANGVLLVDERRPGEAARAAARGLAGGRYDVCDRARSISGLWRDSAPADVPADALPGFLDACVAQRLMRDGDRALSLAVTTPACEWSAEVERPTAESRLGC